MERTRTWGASASASLVLPWISIQLTPVVTLILQTTAALSILAARRPVGHASQLVALRERRVGHSVQGRLGGDGRTPPIAGRTELAEARVVESIGHIFGISVCVCALLFDIALPLKVMIPGGSVEKGKGIFWDGGGEIFAATISRKAKAKAKAKASTK